MSRSLTLLKSLFSSRNPSLRQLPGLSPIFPFSKWSTLRAEASRIHTSSIVEGLEEFFPKTDDIIEEGERAGTVTYLLLTYNAESAFFTVGTCIVLAS